MHFKPLEPEKWSTKKINPFSNNSKWNSTTPFRNPNKIFNTNKKWSTPWRSSSTKLESIKTSAKDKLKWESRKSSKSKRRLISLPKNVIISSKKCRKWKRHFLFKLSKWNNTLWVKTSWLKAWEGKLVKWNSKTNKNFNKR